MLGAIPLQTHDLLDSPSPEERSSQERTRFEGGMTSGLIRAANHFVVTVRIGRPASH